MKKNVVLFLLSVVGLFAQAETVKLGARGTLTVYIGDNWSMETADYGDRRIIKIRPKGTTVNAHG